MESTTSSTLCDNSSEKHTETEEAIKASDEEVDAKPANESDAKPSEVDAKPIVRPPAPKNTDPIVIPTEKESRNYVLDGIKKVIIFNQKKFVSRLQLGERRGTEVDVKTIQQTFKSLDWEIDLHNDLTVAQIRKVILEDIQLRYAIMNILIPFMWVIKVIKIWRLFLMQFSSIKFITALA